MKQHNYFSDHFSPIIFFFFFVMKKTKKVFFCRADCDTLSFPFPPIFCLSVFLFSFSNCLAHNFHKNFYRVWSSHQSFTWTTSSHWISLRFSSNPAVSLFSKGKSSFPHSITGKNLLSLNVSWLVTKKALVGDDTKISICLIVICPDDHLLDGDTLSHQMHLH